jgi:hypothetical protein
LVFFEAFQSAIEEVICFRREGHAPLARFESSETLANFYEQLRAYEVEVAAIRSLPGMSVIGLPQTLYWGLTFLLRSLPESHRITEKALVTAVFTCARKLAESHDRQVIALRNAALSDDRLSIARRLVEKISESSVPLKLRDLVKFFKRQNGNLYLPVLGALVNAEVLLRDDDKGYRLGSVEFEDAADLIVADLEGAADRV